MSKCAIAGLVWVDLKQRPKAELLGRNQVIELMKSRCWEGEVVKSEEVGDTTL